MVTSKPNLLDIRLVGIMVDFVVIVNVARIEVLQGPAAEEPLHPLEGMPERAGLNWWW